MTDMHLVILVFNSHPRRVALIDLGACHFRRTYWPNNNWEMSVMGEGDESQLWHYMQKLGIWRKECHPLNQRAVANDRIMRKVLSITDIPDIDLRSFVPGTNRSVRRDHSSGLKNMAYCLIGIFDVNLIVAYGKGPTSRLSRHR
ncbi:hypothetical protein EDB19DRAFT_1834103 [Suillus lakei]|nr:hypothetical protein EDB19DRAFT_1834103 [Suillus lakei]